MPKYGWFKTALKTPNVIYEGDYMRIDKEYVQIWRYGTAAASPGHNDLIAVIRLDKGQDVREIIDATE